MKNIIYTVFITLILLSCSGDNDNEKKLDNNNFGVTVEGTVDKDYSVGGDGQESMFILDKGFKN